MSDNVSKQAVVERVEELESRVSNLKDWENKYKKESAEWQKEKEKLQKDAAAVIKLREVLYQVIGTYSVPSKVSTESTLPTDTLNIKHEKLTINITHEEKPVNMTTGTVNGKVLFCASAVLPKEGFAEAELSETLKDHGWNVGHSTLAPTLGGLVRDGYLIKLEGTRPMKYRLPIKVKLNVTRE